MTNEEAIEIIKSNYPPEQYTMLRKALDLAIIALQSKDRIPNLEQAKTDKLIRHLKGISESPDNMGNHIRAREALKG